MVKLEFFSSKKNNRCLPLLGIKTRGPEKVLNGSPDLLHNFKISPGQLRLII